MNRRDLIKTFLGILGLKLVPDYTPIKSNLDEIFRLSMEKYQKQIVDIVYQSNSLFYKLIEENTSTMDGGIDMVEPFMYEELDA